ncbi:MAG: peptidoglycan D,D-transpeptidase FtsI family protein [Gammaproteobacteria bacterium]
MKTHRGMIYDRNGEILAMSLPKKTLCINAYQVSKIEKKDLKKYYQLNKIINISNGKFLKILKNNKNKKELYLKRKVDDEIAAKISRLKLPHVYFIEEFHRVYLGGNYFSNIIGFTDIDDKGQEGIEYAKNDQLMSIGGLKKVRKDNLGRSIETIELIKKPVPGKNIYLSLDKKVQLIGYNVLKEYVKKDKAESASLVLIKNKTGEIISMVNYPSFNPENRTEMHGVNIKNRAVTESFEPGSTIKPFTIYTALKDEEFNKKSIIDTSPGILKIGKYEIKDHKYLGKLTLAEIIQQSSNVGASLVALKTSKKSMHNTLRELNFGETLYMDLPGEQSGKLDHHSSWDESQHASMGYGYGLSTTLLHLANAYSVLANHGKKIQLTYEKQKPNEIFFDNALNNKLSKEIINMMTMVVETKKGTGKKAKLQKYTVAGKTGTVRINIGGNYKKNRHLALFVGIVPASNPEYVAAVIVRNPREGQTYGGKNAAPIFKKFMDHSLNLLKVYPDKK